MNNELDLTAAVNPDGTSVRTAVSIGMRLLPALLLGLLLLTGCSRTQPAEVDAIEYVTSYSAPGGQKTISAEGRWYLVIRFVHGADLGIVHTMECVDYSGEYWKPIYQYSSEPVTGKPQLVAVFELPEKRLVDYVKFRNRNSIRIPKEIKGAEPQEPFIRLPVIIDAVSAPVLRTAQFIAEKTTESGVEFSPPRMIATTILVALWLASGFLAATISEMKGRSRIGHFLGGLLIPYAYPAFVRFGLASIQEIAMEQEEDFDPETGSTVVRKIAIPGKSEALHAEAQEKRAEEDRKAGKTDESDELAIKPGVINHYYMTSIMVDENGGVRGPFVFHLADGKTIEVARIVNAMPTTAVVEIIAPSGEARTIRIPYEKIRECALKETE
jgi:hypothetical protein